MQLFDTHSHVQFTDYTVDIQTVLSGAVQNSVTKLMLVGCALPDSKRAVEFAKKYDDMWASIGLHPHEAARYVEDEKALQEFRELATEREVVAIGETGLDYYYNNSPKEQQKELLRFQLSLAQEHDLPLIFHVREAFDDFFAILDEFEGVRGVVHSFTADSTTVDKIVDRGLYIGLNGIMTFTKDAEQLKAAKHIPLQNLVIETDAPFLTPTPYRGTICEPKHVRVTAEFLASLRGESLEDFAVATTKNAQKLFAI